MASSDNEAKLLAQIAEYKKTVGQNGETVIVDETTPSGSGAYLKIEKPPGRLIREEILHVDGSITPQTLVR